MREIYEFTRRKIAVTFDNKNDMLRFLEMCTQIGLKWNCGERANDYYPKCTGAENVALFCGFPKKQNNFLTFANKFRIYAGTEESKWKLINAKEFFTDEPKKQEKRIEIFADGRTVVALTFDGKRVISHGVAKCAPEDDFDFETGAKIAFDRMIKGE